MTRTTKRGRKPDPAPEPTELDRRISKAVSEAIVAELRRLKAEARANGLVGTGPTIVYRMRADGTVVRDVIGSEARADGLVPDMRCCGGQGCRSCDGSGVRVVAVA